MENKRVVPIWLSVLFFVLCIAGLVFDVICLPQTIATGLNGILANILELFLVGSAMLYGFTGYKKDSAKYFKLFCAVYAITQMYHIYAHALFVVPRFSDNPLYVITLIASVLSFGVMFLFTFAENLMKTKSIVLAITLLVCTIIESSAYLIIPAVFIKMLTVVLLNVIFLIMVYAKYLDKAARGTK